MKKKITPISIINNTLLSKSNMAAHTSLPIGDPRPPLPPWPRCLTDTTLLIGEQIPPFPPGTHCPADTSIPCIWCEKITSNYVYNGIWNRVPLCPECQAQCDADVEEEAAKEEAAKAAEAAEAAEAAAEAAAPATAEAAAEAAAPATSEAAAEAAAEGRCDNGIIINDNIINDAISSAAPLCVLDFREVNVEIARASFRMTPCINCSTMTHGDFCPECQAQIDEEISEQDHAIAGPFTRGWI